MSFKQPKLKVEKNSGSYVSRRILSWATMTRSRALLFRNPVVKRGGGPRLKNAVPLNPSIPRPRLNFSVLKKAHKQRVVPELNEDDIKEIFVRGSGPGGQSINKTENNVQLIHKPTNLRVSCQDTRSLEQNRKLARRLLVEKLDKIYNPGLSKEQFKQARQQERERRRRKKAKKRALTKAEILEAE